ncbi:MAG: putative sugar O-methyltransferase [Candidatus Aureabacteria bacterium]|nr:putative sugar O-methyltransferase [Candidatus Auribacterota bacterium]
MNIIACGEGFGIYNIEQICLERGVTLLGYLKGSCEPWRNVTKPSIDITDLHRHKFDYIVLCSLEHEKYHALLKEHSVKGKKILSLVTDTNATLEKLGKVKNIVSRKKGKRNDWDVHALNGKFTGNVPPMMNEESQYGLVEKLLRMYMRIRGDETKFPREFSAGANWASCLALTRKEFYDAVTRNDVRKLTSLLNNCCRNETTVSIGPGGDGFRNFCQAPEDYITSEITTYFKMWKHSLKKDMPIDSVRFPDIGNPYGYLIDNTLVHVIGFYNHYRALYCGDLVSDSQRPVIAEIGGGMGYFAYYLLKEFPQVTYINFDLPEILIISAYLLSMAFPHKRILYYDNPHAVLSKRILSEYDIILMPSFMITAMSNVSADLVINTISLGEMGTANIKAYMDQIARICRRYFYNENLADFCYDYENYPEDCFPVPELFKILAHSPCRWPFFSFESKYHIFMETLYERR